MILQAINISKNTSTKDLYENVSFVINKGDRIGLIGPNGCGKTTLSKILLGTEEPDTGRVARKSGLIAQYMPQDISQAYSEECLQLLSNAMIGEIDKDDRYFTETLTGLELWELVNDQVSAFSGGQRTKIALAAALVFPSDLLILDEPTNFLDLRSVIWLEEFLNQTDHTVLTVSHDRSFLDNVVDEVIFLSQKGVKFYQGGYSDFAREREDELQRQMDLYQVQNRKRKEMERDIRETKEQAKHTESSTKNDAIRRLAKKVAKKAKSRERRLERTLLSEDWVGKPESRPTVFVRFESAIKKGQTLVRADNISFTYDSEYPLITGADITIKAGDKVTLLGCNGCGKSTLLKIIVGNLQATSGSLWVNPNANIGYFSQGLDDLERDMPVLKAIRKDLSIPEEEVRKTLAGLLIKEEKMTQTVRSLSLGERTRIGIVRQILQKPDLLVLDEFCSHLDIDSIVQIQEALNAYQGAVLLVSHDRYLLDSLDIDSWYVLNECSLKPLHGGLEEYEDILSAE